MYHLMLQNICKIVPFLLMSHCRKGSPIENSGSRYRLGKIEPSYSCEINAVGHCNMTCLDCNHASPVCKPSWADPSEVYRDLYALSRSYRAEYVKIVGGEPLLHPDLAALAKAVRRSRIGRRLMLLTNGLLLEKFADNILKSFDLIEISVYPNTQMDADAVSLLRARMKALKVEINMKSYENFRMTFALQGTSDEFLVQRIYDTCKMAHRWDCHSIDHGFVYKCAQAGAIAQILDGCTIKPGADGIQISRGAGFLDTLIGYFRSTSPLNACRYCLGLVGKSRPHQTVPRGEWLSLHNVTTEELIDYEKLYQAENEKAFDEASGRLMS